MSSTMSSVLVRSGQLAASLPVLKDEKNPTKPLNLLSYKYV